MNRYVSSLLLSIFLSPAFAQPIVRAAGQPVYKDTAYRQTYSIKYEKLQVPDPSNLTFKKIACDRNGVIQILSSRGLLRPSGGAFLYPGALTPDKTYKAMSQHNIRDMGVYEHELVYADDKAIFSNAWAGKLYLRHNLTGISLMAPAPEFSFLLSDGHTLQYYKDSTLHWSGAAGNPVLDIRWNARQQSFLILTSQSLSTITPATGKQHIVYQGQGFTCMEPVENSDLVLIGTHNGYFVLDGSSGLPIGEVYRRLPCNDITVIRRIAGKTWFGSARGAFVLRDDSNFDYFASRRWLPADNVIDISRGPRGSVLVLTNKGLGEIHFDTMTLYDKAMYFENQVRDRHIRLGFNSALERIKDGDLSTGSLEDSDNDGLWTSMYLGAEVFRYAATHDPAALQNIRESLDAMERLYTINPLQGFPSRSFERRGYESADTMVWKHSPQQGWDWKSTTSSDEAIGHVFVYGVIADLVEDTTIRNKAIHLLDALMTHVVEHDLYLIDWNGKPTTWGKWNPDYVNARPPMVGDRKINSSNIIAMLQTAYHFTGKAVYREKAIELMNKYGYLDNLMRPMSAIGSAPATADDLSRRLSEGWNHSDDEMYFLGYWGLYRYALNDTLRDKFKAAILDHWQAERPEKEGAWDIFTALTGTPSFDLDSAVWYLQRSPLDMIDWTVSNSRRKDIDSIAPNFRGQSITRVLPPDELPINRHNSNRFDLDGGSNGRTEHSAGDIWLLPYWIGRYLGVIAPPDAQTASTPAPSEPTPVANQSARYNDHPYLQDFSIKYYPTPAAVPNGPASLNPGGAPTAVFRSIASDRNGVIQVLADSTILRPFAGQPLYPGELRTDRTYRPLADRHIRALSEVDGQFIYLDGEALFSNAWAGHLYIQHHLPGAHLLAAGATANSVGDTHAGRLYLISDGRKLVLTTDSSISWTGVSPTPLLAIGYEHQRFYLLSEHTLIAFNPITHALTPVYTGNNLTCVAFHDNKILLGTHNGYVELNETTGWNNGSPSRRNELAGRPLATWHRRLPATDLTTIAFLNGHWWFGSTEGAFMKRDDSGFNYYESERWLPGDHITAISTGPDSSILVLTDKGLGRICWKWMTLEQKATYYEAIVRQRHIRYGFYSDYSSIKNGDVSTAEMGPHDSDNLWTSMYLTGELFRYLVTHDAEANANYHESFDAMERLFTLSGIPGLFGRCIERRGLVEFHEEYRKNIESYWYPGYARVPSSWRHSPDSAWDWRGSSSSDQADGQYYALTMVAQYSDDESLRHRAIRLIDQLTGYILDNGLRLIDVDGRPTLWGLWGPEYVNRFPDMVGDKKLYSSNIISYLQIAWHFTAKEKYHDKALELLQKYHYLQNLTRPVREIGPAPASADAWSKELSGGWNNSDDEMYFLLYPGLYQYALSDSLRRLYGAAIKDHWEVKRSARDGLWDLLYGVITGTTKDDLPETIWELQRMPMDMINWNMHNSQRKDITFLPKNNLEQTTRDVLPPDERPQEKHNRNLFDLDDNGNAWGELGGGDVFLLPYWMGRYFGAISAPSEPISAPSEPIANKINP